MTETCEPSEDSDQTGNPPSLIRVSAVHMKKPWVLSYPLSAQRRLIRLCGCPGWSESSLCARVILLILSCCQHYCLFSWNSPIKRWYLGSSPILFNLYVSDLQNYLGFDTVYVNCLRYADVLVLISRSEAGLQGLIDRLSDYCKRWRMEVNNDKTKILKFSAMVWWLL